MSNIDKRFKKLKPHVLSIRFTNNIFVIDTEFKEGWELPKSDKVGYEIVPNIENTYMLYPQTEEVGVDDILDYVEYVIKVNIEREQKIELLQVKINELKHIFTKQSLEKCKTLKFSFEEKLIPTVNNEDLKLPIISDSNDIQVDENKKNEVIEGNLDEIPADDISEKDPEVERFNKMNNTAKVNNETFDLPPKSLGEKPKLEHFDEPTIVCKCDPNDLNEVCPICVDTKY